MAVTKRLRYEILRRDSHTCRYCGAKAPDAELTVDHVIPKALGGSDDPSNLVAACRDCNSGKTSANPDAPVVANVSDDALRWSRAMTEAADRMRADFAQRQTAYGQFEEWWGNWTQGFKKLPIPKPEDWRNSIDSFLAAGLPLDVLKWCVDKAMTSKATPESTWRYMCGIAWKKITELQDAARSITGGGDTLVAASPRPADRYLAGQIDIANRLLSLLDEEDRAKELEWADDREWCKAHDEPVKSDEEIVTSAALHALEACQSDLYRLGSEITKALKKLPGGIGQNAMRDARINLFEQYGAGFSRQLFLGLALAYLEDESAYPEADAYLESLGDEASTEWIALALETHRDLLLSDKGTAVRAAVRARHGLRLPRDRGNCLGTGKHTPVCLDSPAYFARITGWGCCEDKEHEGHPVCERHFEQLADGDLAAPDGSIFNAIDYSEYKPPDDPWELF